MTQSFTELDPTTLNKVFLTHQAVKEQILLHDGGNNYNLPHKAKDRLTRSNSLPESIPLTDEVRAKIQQLRPHLVVPGDNIEPIDAEDNGVQEV